MADTFADAIRAKYPGAYDRVPDAVLVAKWTEKYGTPPSAATEGMAAPSKPGDLSPHDIAQSGMEMGLSGSLPERTPAGVAALGAGMLAAPAIVAGGGAAGLTAAGVWEGLKDAAVIGATQYGVSKLPSYLQTPAELALAAAGLKTKTGSALLKRFGYGEKEEPSTGVTREMQINGLSGGDNIPPTPKLPQGFQPPSAKAEAFSVPPSLNAKAFEDMMNTLHPEEGGPLPGNGTFGKPIAPRPITQSQAMAMEPDFLSQDVVRYPRVPGILRSDESVQGLAQELSPGVKLKNLKTYPRPKGTNETARALRQRANIAKGGK